MKNSFSLFKVSVYRLTQVSKKSVVYHCIKFLPARSYCVSSNNGPNSKKNEEAIRNAQATEIFRASYLSFSKSSVRVSTSDLDDLLTHQRVRPSVLLPLLQFSGLSLGIMSRALPTKCSETLNSVIHESTIQQFNDTIRDLSSSTSASSEKPSGFHFDSADDPSSEEIKDTMKYHRDIATNISCSQEQNSSSTSVKSRQTESSSSSHQDSSDSRFNPLLLGATSTVYNILKVTRSL
jgi:hypothetical protein